MATIAELLGYYQRLHRVSDSARLDTEILLGHCLGKQRSYLRAFTEREVSAEVCQQFESMLQRRAQGEPIAYIIGYRDFWRFELEVAPSTLIPRPETELLVEQALAVLQQQQAKVLDLGTGTGAVALALASERGDWNIVATDCQTDVVSLAEKNRQRLRIDNVQVMVSDWFAAIDQHDFDLIVSNPPYIDPADPHLQQGDLRFEPRSALVADKNGIADIETIIHGAPDYLQTGGWLLFEHGYHQGDEARALLQRRGFQQVSTWRDLAGLDRVSGGCWL